MQTPKIEDTDRLSSKPRVRIPFPKGHMSKAPLQFRDARRQSSLDNTEDHGINLWDALQQSGSCMMANTAEFDVLRSHKFAGTMLDFTAIATSKKEWLYHPLHAVTCAIQELDDMVGNDAKDEIERLTQTAMDHYLVELGLDMLDTVPGPHFTIVDARLCKNSRDMIAKAKRLVMLFEKKGVDRKRIIVTIPATEAGVRAAQVLEQEHQILTNLNVVTGMTHAAACVEAKASFVTISALHLFAAHEYLGLELSPHSNDFAESPSIKASKAVMARVRNTKTKVMLTDILSEKYRQKDVQHMKGVDYVALRTEDASNIRRSRVSLRDDTGEINSTPQLVLNAKGGFMQEMTDEERKVAQMALHQYLATAAYIFQDISDHDLRPHVASLLYSRSLEPSSIATIYDEDVLAERILSRLERRLRTKPEIERPPLEEKVRKLTNIIRWRHLGYRLQSSVWWDSPSA